MYVVKQENAVLALGVTCSGALKYRPLPSSVDAPKGEAFVPDSPKSLSINIVSTCI